MNDILRLTLQTLEQLNPLSHLGVELLTTQECTTSAAIQMILGHPFLNVFFLSCHLTKVKQIIRQR
jgi:hypothetical protein